MVFWHNNESRKFYFQEESGIRRPEICSTVFFLLWDSNSCGNNALVPRLLAWRLSPCDFMGLCCEAFFTWVPLASITSRMTPFSNTAWHLSGFSA